MSILKNRLCKKLMTAIPGIEVKPDDLVPATGSWRTNKSLDVYCWEGYYRDEDGIRRFFGSYQTMTELVKCKSFEISSHGELTGVKDEA